METPKNFYIFPRLISAPGDSTHLTEGRPSTKGSDSYNRWHPFSLAQQERAGVRGKKPWATEEAQDQQTKPINLFSKQLVFQRSVHSRSLALLLFLICCLISSQSHASWIWVEGESPSQSQMNRHPWWYDKVKTNEFSGSGFISNFSDDKDGKAVYQVQAPEAGDYEFWVRANPTAAKMTFSLNGNPETAIPLDSQAQQVINVAADNAVDLRFIGWIKVGRIPLRAGSNTIQFRMNSQNHHHGMLDCFVLSTEPFEPNGALKPGVAGRQDRAGLAETGWFPFAPKPDTFAESPLDLRRLNETAAGENGFIAVKGDEFVHSKNGQPIRFWAVNGPPGNAKDPAELRKIARQLAKHGVNMVRVHGPLFKAGGEPDPEKVRHAFDIVEAMKAEGIYVHFSIYFPLWMDPKPDVPWLKGYDGKTHPFAALYFNKDFQKQYQQWWKALLQTPNPATGKALAEEPAVASLEMINEDSFFFWTFNEKNIPDPELRLLEKQFGDWLLWKYGSLEAAAARWNGQKLGRDNLAEGRVGFRPLWNMFNEKSVRDQDTVRFLFETQRDFYAETYRFLRGLGFKGVITASNWATASPQVFGPLEKWSYTVTDFVDRHGYFSSNSKGEASDWSIRDGQTYSDRSALRFDAEQPGKPRQFVHPAMDPTYDGKPSMISETTWNRPNRYRSEAPLYYAAYGALQGSDGIVHFALDGGNWSVKPGYFMQPWTLMSPAMMGQFPAAALIYRLGLVAKGDVAAEIKLSQEDLLHLKGTPLPQDASLDELRLKDVPSGGEVKPGQLIDPLIHYVGPVSVSFTKDQGKSTIKDLSQLVNRKAQTVSSDTGELKLDYGKGLLFINASRAQGISGALKAAGTVDLKDLSVQSEMDLGHIIVVPLDGQPIATSSRMLLQVMSEEKSSGFATEPASEQTYRIKNIGHDPWLVRDLSGTLKFKREDARALRVQALDLNGYPTGATGTAEEITLKAGTLYYWITR